MRLTGCFALQTLTPASLAHLHQSLTKADRICRVRPNLSVAKDVTAARAMFSKKDKAKSDEADSAESKPAAEGEDGETPAKKKMAGKTLILFVVLPALLVVGGGGAAAMMLLGGGKSEASASAHPGETDHAAADEHGEKAEDDGHGKPAKGKDDHGADDGHGGSAPVGAIEVGHIIPGAAGDPSYYDMPKMIVNLAGTEGGRPLLLELELVLESSHASTFDQVPSLMPRLMDQIQTFLRELRVEDLNGSAGTYRLRLELLKRFNIVMAPQKLDAVLIEGILIQ